MSNESYPIVKTEKTADGYVTSFQADKSSIFVRPATKEEIAALKKAD